VSDAETMADEINVALAIGIIGSLRVFGDWFGRPYDNWHTVGAAEASADGRALILRFDGSETLEVRDPRGLTVSTRGLSIADAAFVRWEWFLYGSERTQENRCYIEHVQCEDVISATSNAPGVDSACFHPTRRSPAVELISPG